ncbi:MAG: hypothetical protein QOF03_1453 [Alphaproteobacteria bacterium]|jgi:hypothetical protein|nr:hypothetical protein [Alphaproteobacteria bacterium]
MAYSQKRLAGALFSTSPNVGRSNRCSEAKAVRVGGLVIRPPTRLARFAHLADLPTRGR